MPESTTPATEPEPAAASSDDTVKTPKPRAKKAPAPADETVAAAVAPTEPVAEVSPKAKRGFPVKLAVGIGAPLLAILVTGALVALNLQHINDQIAVWGYEEDDAISSYAEGTTMTEHSLWLLKASKPRIAADSQFNDICGNHEAGTGVLGCYTPSNKHITLFEVSDERLSGLRQAVVSHEMLHAAWDRLSPGEQDHLSTLFDAELERLADDDDFQDQLDAYDFDGSGEKYNELHSILATEVTGISDALETYYSQYFEDRDALVSYYADAHGVLVEIAAKVEALNDELDALDEEITADQKRYEDGWDKLNRDWDAFKARNDAYYYSSREAQFYRERNALTARGKELDKLWDDIQAKIDTYNEKLDELTDLDAEAADLFESINVEQRSATS